jgi:hypothetical protein
MYDRRDDGSESAPSPSPPSSLTHAHRWIGSRNPNWDSVPKSVILTNLSVYDRKYGSSQSSPSLSPPSSLTYTKRESKTRPTYDCRFHERLKTKTNWGFYTPRIHWLPRVEKILSLVSGLMVTQEARDLVRRAKHQRTWVHMKVRRMGVVGRETCREEWPKEGA